jgi:pre-mRNA-splicing helicase BRR2
MEMEDDKRTALLQMDANKTSVNSAAEVTMSNTNIFARRDVATFVNSYPTLDVSQELVKGDYTAGSPIVLQVTLSRDVDEEDESDDQTVVAPFYPFKKMANWWLVVGEPNTRQLLVIKKVTVNKSLVVKLEFTLPKGKHSLKLFVICDSYFGADHDIPLPPIEVMEGEESDSDEDMESGDEMEE